MQVERKKPGRSPASVPGWVGLTSLGRGRRGGARWGGRATGEELVGTFCCVRDGLYFRLGGGFTDLLICKNYLSCALRICDITVLCWTSKKKWKHKNRKGMWPECSLWGFRAESFPLRGSIRSGCDEFKAQGKSPTEAGQNPASLRMAFHPPMASLSPPPPSSLLTNKGENHPSQHKAGTGTFREGESPSFPNSLWRMKLRRISYPFQGQTQKIWK